MAAFWWEPKTNDELSVILELSPRRTRRLVQALADRGIAVIVRGADGKRRVMGFMEYGNRKMHADHEAAWAAYDAIAARQVQCPHCQRLFIPPRTKNI
jgi:hypothetical protein